MSVRVVRSAAPWLACSGYALCVIDYYSRYLDANLRFVPPKLLGAPEDILGFGFLSVWIPVALVFGLTCWTAFSTVRRRVVAGVVSAFIFLSLVDLFLYQRLAAQVLAFNGG